MWDAVLSSGKLLYGLATDDAHHFKRAGDPDAAGPGRGWVMVRAPRLGAREILAALERGEFYASTGVVLDDVQVTSTRYAVTIAVEGISRYTTGCFRQRRPTPRSMSSGATRATFGPWCRSRTASRPGLSR